MAIEEKREAPDSDAPLLQAGKHPAAGAVVVHASSKEAFADIIPLLATLPSEISVHVTSPEDQHAALLVEAERGNRAIQLFAVSASDSDAQSLLQVIPELARQGIATFCRICTFPEGNRAIQRHALDDLIGNPSLVGEILSAFSADPSLRIVGSAIDRVSMRAETPPRLTKIELLAQLVQPSLPWNWAFHSTGSFWGRVRDFEALVELEQTQQLGQSTSKSPNINTWPNAFERLFGSVAVVGNSTIGLIDHAIDNPTAELRIIRADQPAATRPEAARAKLLDLHGQRILDRYLLLQDANLLDPWWYYQQYPELMDTWEDCLRHHLANGTPALNPLHEAGKLAYAVSGQGLDVSSASDGSTRSVERRHRYLSDTLLPLIEPQQDATRDAIKVSVICPTYNHETMLAQCLASILAQETDFAFEIIVGNDASSDGTQAIIDDYAARYPGKIVAIHRQANLGAAANVADLLLQARGAYIALCEGDDYWSHPHKLQLQADHLDTHKRCMLHFHAVTVIDEVRGSSPDVMPKNLAGQIFTHDHLVNANFIPTNGVMYRRTARMAAMLAPGGKHSALLLDWLGHILIAMEGEIHMTPSILGTYRKHHGGMWSQHIGASFIPRWGRYYLDFHSQARLLTGSHHHPLYCQRELDWFGKLFRHYFLTSDCARLWRLIDDHRDCARIFFGKDDGAIDIDAMHSQEDLASTLRSKLHVSTIVLVDDHGEHLGQCLSSIDSQQGLFTHQIVISGSALPASSLATVASFIQKATSDTRVLVSRKQETPRDRLMTAVGACSGTYIAFCHGNDYWSSPHKLAKQLDFLLQHPQSTMCFNLLLVEHEHAATVMHAEQAALAGTEIDFERLMQSNVVSSLSSCLYRKEVFSSLPPPLATSEAFSGWMIHLHAATQGSIGFLRDALAICRTPSDSTSQSGCLDHEDQAANAAFMNTLRAAFHGLHPAAPPARISVDQLPATMAIANSPNLRLHMDRIDTDPGCLVVSGWLTHAAEGSQPGEEKFIFILGNDGAVKRAQHIDTVLRPDVQRFHQEKLGIQHLRFDSAGFRGLVTPLQLEDGEYRVAIGRRLLDGSVSHAIYRTPLRITNGVPDCSL